MKIQVKVSPTIVVDVEAEKQKDLFKKAASAHEVFGETKCGLCGSTNIKPVWRTVTVINGKKPETFEFPEYHCFHVFEETGRRCGARLSMGTINDDTGTLFPQRRLIPDEKGRKDLGRVPNKEDKKNNNNGEYGEHNGWTRFKGRVEADGAEAK